MGSYNIIGVESRGDSFFIQYRFVPLGQGKKGKKPILTEIEISDVVRKNKVELLGVFEDPLQALQSNERANGHETFPCFIRLQFDGQWFALDHKGNVITGGITKAAPEMKGKLATTVPDWMSDEMNVVGIRYVLDSKSLPCEPWFEVGVRAGELTNWHSINTFSVEHIHHLKDVNSFLPRPLRYHKNNNRTNFNVSFKDFEIDIKKSKWPQDFKLTRDKLIPEVKLTESEKLGQEMEEVEREVEKLESRIKKRKAEGQKERETVKRSHSCVAKLFHE